MTMLQFSGIFINSSVRNNTRVPLWCTTQQLVTAYSTFSNLQTEVLGNKTVTRKSSEENENKNTSKANKKKIFVKEDVKIQNLDVQQYFKTNNNVVEKLLSSINEKSLDSKILLNVYTKLSTLVTSGKVKTADFESDPRYKTLCEYMSRNSLVNDKNTNIIPTMQNVQINNLGLLFDINEINKVIEKPNLSMEEAIQILSKLGLFKSRIVPVLQSLRDCIVKSNDTIHMKWASDIMYNMSVLNFYDEQLMLRILPTLIQKIPTIRNDNSAVIGSVLKSIGLLRYRNEELLLTITKWVMKNHASMKPQYVSSFFVTLAVVGYVPTDNLQEFQSFTSQFQETDMSTASDWLDVVWSLVILNQAKEEQIMSVINSDFLEKLSVVSKLTEIRKRKILNINAAAKILFNKNTDHILNQDSSIFNVTLEKNQHQQDFVKRIVTALFAFLPCKGCVNMDVDTKLGFSVDAEFYVDENCNPIILTLIESTEKKPFKLAIQALTYYDYCLGDNKVMGHVNFQNSLLKLMNYHVISVSYKDFKLNQKVVEHVKYLRALIDNTVKSVSK
ncbi:uncharacterized protein LOC127278915 [Leptopilina boulardi]|uniref:uncharacterized protein LOC127278915 n=1 Tax=Leptopilina boulardi TaxID=63433 RepID=UPI0021F6382F|nr:uncharacterized protein LOC127278915 [Leptopilina boulardi]